jgi:hypothetical protein
VLATVTAVVTVAFLIVLATNVAPWLRGPKAWRWPYAIPGATSRLWLPAMLLVLYVALAVWLARGTGPRSGAGRVGREDLTLMRGHDGGRRREDLAPTRWVVMVAIVASMLMTPGIQLALLYMDHVDVRSQLFYRTVAEGANGFFNVGAVVMDRYDFLRYFSERAIDWYPTHAERHPPGLPVLFSLARQWFDTTPRLTARLNDLYRTYQCHNVPLMNLPDGAIASATIQMALPLVLSLVVPPLYLLGREVYGRAAAVRAVLLWPLVPGIALWSAYWTPLYALFTVLALLLLHVGLSRHRLALLAGSGLVISISTFLSFGNAAIVGFLGLYALFWLANVYWRTPNVQGENIPTAPGKSILSLSKDAPSKDIPSKDVLSQKPPTWSWLLGGVLLFVLGAASLWLWLWFRYRLGFFAVWQTAMGRHFEMERTGWFWILYHLYDFYVAAAGIPILFFWAARTWDALRDIRSRWRALDVLALSFFVGLVLLDLSGVARGEVARVWAFLLPLPLLIAVYRLPRRGSAFPALIVLLSLQLFVTNVFVRYIGTDLSDPPAPPARAVLDGDWTPWQATWEEGIALDAVQMPRAIVAGQPIAIGAIWSTSQQVHRPYTAFVHMFDEQGWLVAQRDVMHLDGGWPTTCWRPGESFEDTYTLVQLEPLVPGAHRVEIGLYWLPSGDRLPVTGQGAQPHQAVAISEIDVQSQP